MRKLSDDNLQLEWDSLVKWSSEVALPINFGKCKVMDFITKKTLRLLPISISPTENVKSVASLTFLGVTFSNDFRWNNHFDVILKKAVKRISILRNLRISNCSTDLLWKVYESLIRSLFMYASPCFCNAPDYLFKRFLTFERRVCRIANVVPDSRPSINCVLDDMCKRLFNQVVLFFNHPLRALFEVRACGKTRSTHMFRHPRSSTKRWKNSFIKYCT